MYTYDDYTVKRIFQRILDYSDPEACWQCTGAHVANRPVIWYAGKQVRIVNWLWDYIRGRPKKGLHHCHTCKNDWCANISHIYIGTSQQNIDDRAKPTHCPKGHEYTKENTNLVTKPNGYVQMRCRACTHVYDHKRYVQLKLHAEQT